MNFNNKVIKHVNIFNKDIWITETIINTWIIMAFIITMAILARIYLKKFTNSSTKKTQNFIEVLVEGMDNLVKQIMGADKAHFGNWFFGIFAFTVISNLIGLITLRPPTADVSTTFALSISTFCIIQFMAVKTKKLEYFKEFLSPCFIFLPINIIGELAIPISLGFRLFGNILGGLIIVGMTYALLPTFLLIILPDILHGYFDVFSGILQAFIFMVLSMTFIKNKIS